MAERKGGGKCSLPTEEERRGNEPDEKEVSRRKSTTVKSERSEAAVPCGGKKIRSRRKHEQNRTIGKGG